MNEQKTEYVINNILMRLERLSKNIEINNERLVSLKECIQSLGRRDDDNKEREFDKEFLTKITKKLLTRHLFPEDYIE